MKTRLLIVSTAILLAFQIIASDCLKITDNVLSQPQSKIDEKTLIEMKVISSKQLNTEQGITEPYYMELEGSHSIIFKKLSYVHIYNHPMQEILAYKIAKELGIENVPLTVLKEVNDELGSAQLFIKETKALDDLDEEKRALDSEVENIRTLFDYLITNMDRHTGNILKDNAGNTYFIDHSMAFGGGTEGHRFNNIRDAVPNMERLRDRIKEDFEYLNVPNQYLFLKYFELGNTEKGKEIIKALRNLSPEKLTEMSKGHISDLKLKILIDKRKAILDFYDEIEKIGFVAPYASTTLKLQVQMRNKGVPIF